MLDFYEEYWRPFGEILSDMEVTGIRVDLEKLKALEAEATAEREALERDVRDWVVDVARKRHGLKPVAYTTKGLPSVSSDNLKALCKEQAGVLGPAGVHAIESCLALSELDTLIGTFLRPLQSHGRSGRVHSSFNLNTETGRLSSLNPNLQNVPYGGRFRVRDAFVAGPGKCFVIADYAQLELRVVAHLAACRPMIDALNAGGDFHSRTAAKMFPEITKAIKRGKVVLEGGDDSATSSSSGPPAVRERFAEERRKAKTLNFSVLYGKTEFGLAKDWGKTRKQAANIIRRWFSAFPEIEVWQEKMRDYAMKHEGVTTLLGRSRKLYDVGSANENMRNAALRAAINTPVQGSAADIVTMAMLKLHESELLQQLGFRLVLQIHDEVILEGPIEHGDRAREEVVRVMENPLPFHLMAELKVDSRTATFWNRG